MPALDVLTTVGEVREVWLDNGLKILIKELHTTPLVSVFSWYRVGSGDEPSGLTGVSHWVEHMNFKGTAQIPRDRMKGIVEKSGGMWNGYTWIDQTTYLETASSAALDQMLFLEAQRMSASLFERHECEAERTVIISELQGGENDPEQLLDIEVTATALRVHPYGHPTLGWLQDLQSMTRDDLYGHYRRYYVPRNATLVVVGNVDADDVVRRVERHFGQIPGGEIARHNRPEEPSQLGERRVMLEREGTTSYLKLAYPAPAARDAGFFPLLVLDAVLTGAKGLSLWCAFRGAPPQRKSRLYTSLVDQGLASMVSGAVLPTIDPFLYTLSMTAADGVPLEALEEAALGQLEDVMRHGVTDVEVARAKRQLRARLVFENDSVTNVAHQLGYFETVGGAGYFEEVEDRIASVTVQQVVEAAKHRLNPMRRTVGWFRPTGLRP
ncbi:MAG TPA: pitrilysin family protein [Vicinamibacterales bacterium]|nr:pitrilysin family protein [Vicinamibacterales bacterium]